MIPVSDLHPAGRPALRGTCPLRIAACVAISAAFFASGCKPAGSPEGAAERPLVSIRGDFRLGPFLAGGKVTATPLDDRGQPYGTPAQAALSDDSGDFEMAVPAGAVELRALGDYFDLLLARASTGGLTLRAVAMTSGARIHVNAVTHLAAGRALKLMAAGARPVDAIARAESELRAGLGIPTGESGAKAAGSDLDLLGGSDARTQYLAAVTSILDAACLPEAHGAPDRISAQMQFLLDTLASDLADDGEIVKALRERLRAAQASLDGALPAAGLAIWAAAHGSKASLPDLGSLLDADGDGTANAKDDDDDGDKVADAIDCAPLDPLRSMLKNFSQECVAPFPPPALVAFPGDKQVELFWDTIPGPVKYTVIWSPGEALSEAAAKTVADAKPGQAVTGLENGKPYRFAVRTGYGGAESRLSAAAAAIPMAKVSGLRAATGTGKIILSWDTADGAADYVVYMRAGSAVDKGDQRIPGVTSPFLVDKVQNGTRYAFAVAPAHSGSEGALGSPVSAVPLGSPGHTGLVSQDHALILSWDSVPGARAYTVFYREGDSAAPAGMTLANRVSPDTLKNLVNGTRYSVRVQALAPEGASDTGSATSAAPIGAPSALAVSAATGVITATWKAADGAGGYAVYYRKDASGEARVSVLAPPLRIEGLTNGIRYGIRVAATAGSTESPLCDTSGVTPLAAPEGLVADIGNGSVTLRWAPVAGAARYSIHHAQGTAVDTAADRSESPVASVKVDGLKNDLVYAFIVRAEGPGSASDASRTVHAIPMTPVTGVLLAAKPDTLFLSWDPLAGASAYAVFCGTQGQVSKDSLRFLGTASPFPVTGLREGGEYTCAVEASKNGFPGPLSDSRTAAFHASALPVGAGSVSDSSASYLSLALDAGDKPILAFIDVGKGKDPHDRLRVSAFDGKEWQSLPAPANATPFSCCALRLDGKGNPVLAFGDQEQGGKAVVKTFAGGSWTMSGGAPASEAKTEYVAMSLSADGRPWVAYNDAGKGGRATVKRLQGAQWELAGTAGFTTNPVGALALEIGPDGIPLAGNAGVGQYLPSVFSFVDPAWQPLADPGRLLEQGSTGQMALATGAAGAYVAFGDRAAGFRGTVARWENGSWRVLGAAGFTPQGLSVLSLAVDGQGIPYLAFADESRGGRLSVMKFADGSWKFACRPGISAGTVSSISVAAGGAAVVAYRDAALGGKAFVLRLVP